MARHKLPTARQERLGQYWFEHNATREIRTGVARAKQDSGAGGVFSRLRGFFSFSAGSRAAQGPKVYTSDCAL